MILGVDHLALTTNDLDSTHRSLVSQGFECVFMERDVKNHSAKRLMLHDFQPVHDLALYRAESGVAIEVTRHGATCGPVQAPFDYERDVVTLHTEDVSCEQGFLKAALQFREKEAGLCLEVRCLVGLVVCTLLNVQVGELTPWIRPVIPVWLF